MNEREKEYAELRDSQRTSHEKIMRELNEVGLRLKETERLIKANARQIGGIDKSLGEMTEEFIYYALEKDCKFCGIQFFDIQRKMKRFKKNLNLKGEFDFVLTNGDTIAIIEAKHKVRPADIFKLVDKKIDDFRKLFPMFYDYKIVLGVGGMSFEENAEEEAIKNGIGIIKVVGERVEFYTDNIKIY